MREKQSPHQSIEGLALAGSDEVAGSGFCEITLIGRVRVRPKPASLRGDQDEQDGGDQVETGLSDRALPLILTWPGLAGSSPPTALTRTVFPDFLAPISTRPGRP